MTKIPLWSRILLGLLGLAILAFTLPAYFNPSVNPALSGLPAEFAALGSVGGAFLGRQLVIAILAVYGAWKGDRVPATLGAFAIGFFNLHDGIFMLAFGPNYTGAVAGLVFAIAAGSVLFAARRAR